MPGLVLILVEVMVLLIPRLISQLITNYHLDDFVNNEVIVNISFILHLES